MDKDFKSEYRERIFLQQSNIIVSREPVLIQTILGSCVAVCIWDNMNGIGGMSHYLMPLWNGEGLATPKFGNIAIEALIEKILKRGGNQKHLKAKLFGGGNVIVKANENITVGQKNVDLAYSLLKQHNIKIVKEDVLGHKGRNVLFNTGDGSAYLKYINSIIEKHRIKIMSK